MSLPPWRSPAGQSGGEFEGGGTARRSRSSWTPSRAEAPTCIAVAGPGVVHGFKAIGEERLQMVAVHAAPRFDTTWG